MSIHTPSENPLNLYIDWRQELRTGTSSAIQWNGSSLIAGNNWNRRTDAKPEKQGGSLTVVGDNFETFSLSSRVNTLLQLPDDRAFVGCHNGEFYIIQTKGVQRSSINGQSRSGGITGATYSPSRNLILATTSTGKVITINPDTASQYAEIPFAKPIAGKYTRLSVITMDPEERTIFTGDYEGTIYKLYDHIQQVNLKREVTATPHLSPTEKPLGPSVSAIEFLPSGNIIVGTRWKQLFVLTPELQVVKTINFPANITELKVLDAQNLLIGTRNGRLLLCQFTDSNDPEITDMQQLCQEPSSNQPENSVQSINKNGSNILVTFADGIVYQLHTENE